MYGLYLNTLGQCVLDILRKYRCKQIAIYGVSSDQRPVA